MKIYEPITPQAVEACQFLATRDSFLEIRGWVGESFYYDYQEHPRVFLKREGVNNGDWIVKITTPITKFIVMSDTDFRQKYIVPKQ